MNVQLYYYYCNLLALFLLIQLLPPSQTTIILTTTTTTIPTIKNNNNNDTNNQTENGTTSTQPTTSFITIQQQNNNNKIQEQKIIRRLWSPYTTTPPPSSSSSSPSSSTFWTQHSNSPLSEQSTTLTSTTTKSPQNTPDEQRTTTLVLKTNSNVAAPSPKIRTVRQSVNRNYIEDEDEKDYEEDDEDEEDDDEEEEDEGEDDEEEDDHNNDVLNDQVDKEKSTHEVGVGGGRRRGGGSRQHNDVESWIQSHKLHSLSASSSSFSSLESHIDSHSTSHGGGSTSTSSSGSGGPIISSIRHHKSRKSFQRTRKVKPSSEKLKPTTTASKLISTVFNTQEQGEEEEEEQEQADQPILHHYPILPTLRSSSPSKSLLPSSSSTDKPFSSSGTRKLFSPSQQQYQQSFLSKQQQEQQERDETSGESVDGKKSEERFINDNNDSSIIYGKPYFTPFKNQRQQQNQQKNSSASSLNRIKNFLRNATNTNSRPDANNINVLDRLLLLEGANLERIQDEEQAGSSRKRKEEDEQEVGISKTSSFSAPVDHENGSKSADNRVRIDAAAARTIPTVRNRKTEGETYDDEVYQGTRSTTTTTTTTMLYPTKRGDTRVRTNRRLKNKQRSNNNNSSTDASVNAMTNSSSSSPPTTRRTKNNNKGIKANKGDGDNQNLNKQSSTSSSRDDKIPENNNNGKFPAKGTSVARGSRRKLSGTKNRGEGLGVAGLHDHVPDHHDDDDGGGSAGTVYQQRQGPSDHLNNHQANDDQNPASSSDRGGGGGQRSSAAENNSETWEDVRTKVSSTVGAGDSEDSSNDNNWWWNDNNNNNKNRRINSADGENGGGGSGSTSSAEREPDFTQHSIIVPAVSPEELLKQDVAPLTEENSSYFPESVSKDDNNNSNSNRTTNNINNNSLFNDYNLLGSDEEQEIRDVLQASISPVESGAAAGADDEESASLTSSPSSSSGGEGSSSSASLASSFSSSSAASGLHHQSKTKPDIDIVTKFLRIVETQHTLGDNCTAGTAFSLGEGVVDRYAQERFRLEAEIAVNRANMLTRLWKYAGPRVLDSEYLLHASLFSMVEFDDDIFAAGNCYDKLQYKNYTLFCPFAYRLPEGNILVKDLAVEYKYLSNTSEWFYIARKNAERVIKNHNQFSKGFHSYTYNESTHTDRVEDEILNVTYDDGKWSKPYFDCGGGNIWMMTYTVPFFGFKDDHYFFKGTSGIDIDLRRVDIDQCPLPENSTELNIFAASDKCKNATTKCVPIKGLGFRRGSYRCVCQPGYYFPNTSSTIKYFNGTVLEEEYEKKLMKEETVYDEDGAFECLKCLEGCDTCVDDRPCVVTLNWLMRSGIVILQCAIIAMLPIVGLFTWKYSDIKVVRAASPVLLRFIVLGAFLIYCTILVLYPSPSVFTCTMRIWLREIGFSLAYGALMLKTWRISVIFRVRSAKAVKITDLDLMKRLGVIVAIFTALLVIRTLVAPPVAIVSLTADDLKAWLCKTDWWDHSFTIMELLFLVWGIRLCIVVRKAPSEFNESKFISLAIYNEFLLSVFLNISMLFLQSPANPDLLYIICFCHVQLTMTLLLCLIFGSKAYMVFRGHGKGNPSDEPRVPTFISKNRSGQKPKQPSGQNSTTGMHSSTTSTSHAYDPNFNSRLSEDVQEEFRRLYYQLEELKERNMRFGNRHLVAKIRAMQEAADSILGTNAAGATITSSNCHLQPNTEMIIGGRGDSGGGGNSSSGGGGSSNEEVPASSNVLSDITEEDGVGNNGSGSGGAKGKDSKKRLSFFGRVKSPKGLVPRRSKSAKTNNNSGSGSDNGGASTDGSGGGGSNKSKSKSSPIKKALAGSKSAQQQQQQHDQQDKAGKKATTVTEGGAACDGATTKIEDDEDSNNVLLAHGGVYIGEVKDERPGGGVTSRGTSIKKSPKPSKQQSQQEAAVVASIQVHPPASSSSSSSVANNRNDGNDNDDSALTSTNSKKCDYFQCKDDQGNCSKDTTTTSTTTGECIAMSVIRLQADRKTKTSSSSMEGGGGRGGGICETVIKSGAGGSSSSEKKSGATTGGGDTSSAGTASKDRNHTGEKNNSKILLDLNDKSRFTEEITV